MSKTVYWSPVIIGQDWPLVSALRFYEPERLIKRINPTEFFGPATAKCPAMVDELKNTFALRSPLDLHIEYEEDFKGAICHTDFEKTFFKEYEHHILDEMITPPNPHRIFQLSYMGHFFFCEEPLTITQLHPYYEDNEYTENVMGISGTMDISSWLRPVQPGFKFKKDKRTINIKDGDAVTYYKFNTEDNVVLKRFDATDLYSSHTGVMKSCLSFKEHKPATHTYSLKACYDAFIKARYHKKTMKYINENLLD